MLKQSGTPKFHVLYVNCTLATKKSQQTLQRNDLLFCSFSFVHHYDGYYKTLKFTRILQQYRSHIITYSPKDEAQQRWQFDRSQLNNCASQILQNYRFTTKNN